jgi:hypothetical protein
LISEEFFFEDYVHWVWITRGKAHDWRCLTGHWRFGFDRALKYLASPEQDACCNEMRFGRRESAVGVYVYICMNALFGLA